ncbi:BON domain-containing protein [Terriglobus roseus]|uniref:Osmotically-inducible protein OsmY, contains BON domain n=1 Tax=Terriglobus roseus TaxID=392734 RepID=A0A1H4PHV5_9BACT|nr:BON domain-containing protein [Terriglobus roseus]SEC06868.1 Osmotically-inducible protein OsmY, contains BON domain [Terriglobus roseus]
MKQPLAITVLCAGLALAPSIVGAQSKATAAQEYNSKTWSQEDAGRIVQEVRHRLLSLSNYSVFDSLSFGMQGRTIVLRGFASRPTLKQDAQRAVKDIPGVETVNNQIKVLPTSPMDDGIRIGVYRRIYTQPALRKYTGAPVGFGAAPSVALEAGGITADPPRGYHAIHIIVDHGHVTLTGVVDRESDANIASMQANGTPGVFSVDNEIVIAGQPSREKMD